MFKYSIYMWIWITLNLFWLDDRTVFADPMFNVTLIIKDKEKNVPIEGALIKIEGKSKLCHTNSDGICKYALPLGDYQLFVSHIAYKKNNIKINIKTDISEIVIFLELKIIKLSENIVIRSNKEENIGTYSLSIEEVSEIPSPSPDPIRALKILPGVSSGNDFSSKINVQGGSFIENLVYMTFGYFG